MRFLSITYFDHQTPLSLSLSTKTRYDVINNLIRAYFIIDVNTISPGNKDFFKTLSNPKTANDISGAVVNKYLSEISTIISRDWIQANIRSELNYIKIRDIPMLPRFEYFESSEKKGASMFQVICAVSHHQNNINTYKIGMCIQLCYEIYILNQHSINCVASHDLNVDGNLDDHIAYIINKIYNISDTYAIFKIVLLFAIVCVTYVSPHVSPKMKELMGEFI